MELWQTTQAQVELGTKRVGNTEPGRGWGFLDAQLYE